MYKSLHHLITIIRCSYNYGSSNKLLNKYNHILINNNNNYNKCSIHLTSCINKSNIKINNEYEHNNNNNNIIKVSRYIDIDI